ncbi:MAG: HAMP domain-containing protein, partial [candidate division Zixibacteria bacterium]|nr:HAMP domain-containing protein [candidate division Zixibacteria bacterium]
MSWKDIKIAKKLYIGFGLILALAIIVGYAGYNGLSTYSQKVANSNDANQVMIWIKDMGAERLKFKFTQDETHYQNLQELSEKTNSQIRATQARFKDSKDVAMANEALSSIEKYCSTWDRWVEISQESKQAQAEIGRQADIFQKQANELSASQQKQMEQEFASRASHSALEERALKSRLADEIVKLFAFSRTAYRNWKLTDDDKYAQEFRQLQADIIEICKQNRALMRKQVNIDQLNNAIAAVETIDNMFVQVHENKNRMDNTYDQLTEEALAVVDVISRIQVGQEEKMHSAQASSISMMIIFLVGAVALGIAIAFVIARGISKPVSNMATIAQEIAVGDINHDIKFTSKDEIGTLADSFRGL